MKLSGRITNEGTEYRILASDEEYFSLPEPLYKRVCTLFQPIDNKPPKLSDALAALTDMARELGY